MEHSQLEASHHLSPSCFCQATCPARREVSRTTAPTGSASNSGRGVRRATLRPTSGEESVGGVLWQRPNATGVVENCAGQYVHQFVPRGCGL
ncbi:unnamed protein product, partial [Mesorhabditis spiculigera]